MQYGESRIMNKRYQDAYGRIWIRVSQTQVYNEEVGYGGWFDGKGLFLLEEKS